MTKLSRWLDLLALLLARRYPMTREAIFARVSGYGIGPDADDTTRESARRMFERDKDELRALGIRIETRDIDDAEYDEPRQGYTLDERDFYLPYLELAGGRTPDRPYRGLRRVPVDPDDLAILDRATRRVADRSESPLASAARSLRRKLAFDLPLPHAGEAIAHLLAQEAAVTSTLATLQRAVAERRALAFLYYSIGRDESGPREVEPWGLFFSWGHWYLVGHSRKRDDTRVFRVERVTEPTIMKGKGAAFEPPGEFDITSYLRRAPWELGREAPISAVIRFAFPGSRTVLARGLGRVRAAVLEDGGAEVEFGVRERGPFLRWLLSHGRGATVLEPPELARELDELRNSVRALYGDDG